MNILLDICRENNFDLSLIKNIELPDGSLLYSVSIKDLEYKKAEEIYKKHQPVFKGEDPSINEWTIWAFAKEFQSIELWETHRNLFQASLIANLQLARIFMVQRSAPGVPIGFAVTLLSPDCIRVEVNRFGPPAHLN